jgi:hypothetical protein
VHSDGCEVATHTRVRQHVAGAAEHAQALDPKVSNDELVEGRRCDSVRTAQQPDTDVADELSVDAEHAHAVVALVSDCDVTVARHEAQSMGSIQLTVAAAVRPEATKKRAVTTAKHSDAVPIHLRHDDDVRVGAHASRLTADHPR